MREFHGLDIHYMLLIPFPTRPQVASGIPTYRADHCAALARLALDMQDALKKYKDASGEPLQASLPTTFGFFIRYFIFTFSWCLI